MQAHKKICVATKILGNLYLLVFLDSPLNFEPLLPFLINRVLNLTKLRSVIFHQFVDGSCFTIYYILSFPIEGAQHKYLISLFYEIRIHFCFSLLFIVNITKNFHLQFDKKQTPSLLFIPTVYLSLN